MEELHKAAEEKKLSIITTDFFSQKSLINGIINQDKFKSVAFNLSGREVSEVQDFGDGYYILQPIEKVPERIPALDEIREKVTADLIKEKLDRKAAEDADMFLAALKKGSSMETESKKYNQSPVSTGFFKRDSEIPNIGYEREVSQAAFRLSSKNPLPENTIKGSNGYYVIRFKNRFEPDKKEFADEKNDTVQRLLEQKKTETFDVWLSQVKRDSEIKIEDNF